MSAERSNTRTATGSATGSGRRRLGLAACLLWLGTTGAQAQDSRVESLERNLRLRDQVIAELLERVEALERRIGVPRIAAEAEQAPARDVTSTDAGAIGSAASAPGAVVVEPGAAERALERSLTRAGALLLPAGVLEIEPGLSYSRREDATPVVTMSGDALLVGRTRRNADSLTTELGLRLGLPWDTQLEFGLPYRWARLESATDVGFAPTGATRRSGTGFGDLRLGVAKTLIRESLWRPDLVGRISWDTRSGERPASGVALGSGFDELGASLTAIKRQDPVVFVGGLSYRHAFERDRVRPGSTIAANFGGYVALSPETSLHLLFSGAYQGQTELAGRGIDGSTRTVGSLALGGSTVLAPGVLLNLSVGVGLTRDADDFSIGLSLPIRLDGVLF